MFRLKNSNILKNSNVLFCLWCQVVAGINYYLKLQLVDTTCRKGSQENKECPAAKNKVVLWFWFDFCFIMLLESESCCTSCWLSLDFRVLQKPTFRFVEPKGNSNRSLTKLLQIKNCARLICFGCVRVCVSLCVLTIQVVKSIELICFS